MLSIGYVAAYALCPRKFFFKAVEGIDIPYEAVEQGSYLHRHVDREEPSARTIQRLTLSSQKLGITGVLDSVEIDTSFAIPVEHKKGYPDRSSGEPRPWPTERVQLGLQSILLEEAGYTVQEAAVYYHSERKRISIPVDAALKQEALDTLAAAMECAKGSRLAPLVNSPKCPKCSLYSVCLPDEINHGEPQPKRSHIPQAEGSLVVIQEQGVKVGVHGECLTIASEAKKQEVPLASVDSVALVGNVQMSTQAIALLSGMGIPLAFLSPTGKLKAMVDPLDSSSAIVRRAQVHTMDDPAKALELVRAVVSAKIANQRVTLLRNLKDKVLAKKMKWERYYAERSSSIDEARGHEGAAAAMYFKNYPSLIKEESIRNRFVGRRKRPAPDPLNACLSFGYSLLTNECVSALRLARLEPCIGALHVSVPGRPALALDLMEPFRPLVVDSFIVLAFNNGNFEPSFFTDGPEGCLLTDDGRRAFFNAYSNRMAAEVTHPFYKYTLSYRRMLYLHAKLIAAWCVGDIKELEFLKTR